MKTCIGVKKLTTAECAREAYDEMRPLSRERVARATPARTRPLERSVCADDIQNV